MTGIGMTRAQRHGDGVWRHDVTWGVRFTRFFHVSQGRVVGVNTSFCVTWAGAVGKWQVALTRALGGWNAGFGTDQYFFERVGP